MVFIIHLFFEYSQLDDNTMSTNLFRMLICNISVDIGLRNMFYRRRVEYVCHKQGSCDTYHMNTENAAEKNVSTGNGTTDRPLHDRLLDEWGTAIVDGDLAPGDRLPEPDLGGERPSRTVTREATRVLESMGLVSVRRKAGATVNPIPRWNMFDPQVVRWRLGGRHRLEALHELSQLRSAVEPLAARLAASHATTDQWAALTEAAIGMVSHSDHADEQDYLDADIMFHRTLMKASGNLMIANLGDVIVATLEGRTQHELMPKTANQEALDLHSEVAALVRKGDGAGAEAAMRRIVTESDDAITRIAGK
ncbi:FadR family transcriptional regulator [Bifidobacterium callimiconis]|uniref:FadR/GntR family transcriptional regulator n=1 Tax=Bifidobacterium callimiconis TaxID=2306973 RepID=UPI001BDBE53D|nr:FadR/GntR family transcriptional regulator [Bifidobacterium callimiconis]MBT1177561.1 FadR family transcriptional regulator [Bifidobacterium callimiconis]